jgi:hypothetical protein
VQHVTPGSDRRSAAPPRLDARIAEVAGSQWSVIGVRQLIALGVDDGAISRRVARGALHRRYRGVYVVGQPTLTREGEWMAAVLAAAPVSALSHLSCGALVGVSRFRERAIAVTTTRRPKLDGVRVHTVRRLDPRDVTTHKGIPVTTVHRMLVDLSDILTAHQIANVIHELAFRGRYVEAAVRDAMVRANGRRKLHVLERAMALHRDGSAGTRSGAEDAFLALVEPEPQVNEGLLGIEVDFHWPELRLAVEIDGAGHLRRATKADDARRDAALAAAGFTTLRFRHTQVFERPAEVLAACRPFGVLPAAGRLDAR